MQQVFSLAEFDQIGVEREREREREREGYPMIFI